MMEQSTEGKLGTKIKIKSKGTFIIIDYVDIWRVVQLSGDKSWTAYIFYVKDTPFRDEYTTYNFEDDDKPIIESMEG